MVLPLFAWKLLAAAYLQYQIEIWIGLLTACLCVYFGGSFVETRRGKISFGLVQLKEFGQSADSIGADVIFVHGLGSHPDRVWSAPRHRHQTQLEEPHSEQGSHYSRVNWVREFLSKDLNPGFRQSTRVYFYNYDSYWHRDAFEADPEQHADHLLNDIRAQIRHDAQTRNRNLIFVAHSFGGLVVKQALVKAQATCTGDNKMIVDKTRAILFLGTPHRGSQFGTIAKIFARALSFVGSNALILRDLEANSSTLDSLHEKFLWLSANIKICNFQEEKHLFLKLGAISIFKAYIVSPNSATFPGQLGQVENFILPADHFNLCKFTNRNEAYRKIKSKLEEHLPFYPSTILSDFPRPISNHVDREEIHFLEDHLHDKRCNTSLPYKVFVDGLSGSGKTQLILRYIEKHQQQWHAICWINAESQSSIISSCRQWIEKAQVIDLTAQSHLIEGFDPEDSRLVNGFRKWFEARHASESAWLMIIDNMDTLRAQVQQLIPATGNGAVIITCCHSIPPSFKSFHTLSLSEMTREESAILLSKHIGDPDIQMSPTDAELIDLLATDLQFFPLALDLAGANISERREKSITSRLEAYRRDLSKYKKQTLKQAPFDNPHRKTTWAAWDLTFDAIRERYGSDEPLQLLFFLSQFDRRNIQDNLFALAVAKFSAYFKNLNVDMNVDKNVPHFLSRFVEEPCQGEEHEWRSHSFNQCFDLLERYRLIQTLAGEWPGITLHELVQSRAIELEVPNKEMISILAIILISSAAEEINQYQKKTEFRRFVTVHTLHILQTSGLLREIHEDARSKIFDTLSWILCSDGRWKESEELNVQVLEMRKRVLGQEHPNTLTSQANLAFTYRHQGRWKEAEKLEVQVLETRKRVLGQQHPDTLTSQANLASTYRNQGRWKEAEELEIQVIETRKQVLGQEHPDTLTSQANLASTYYRQGRWKEAEELEVQVIETRKRVLGQEHPDTLTSQANLASTYWNQGRWQEAEELDVQVIETRKRVLGQEHPSTLTSQANLAFTYRSQRRTSEAIQVMAQCADLRLHKLGKDHPDTQSSFRTLEEWKSGEEERDQQDDRGDEEGEEGEEKDR